MSEPGTAGPERADPEHAAPEHASTGRMALSLFCFALALRLAAILWLEPQRAAGGASPWDFGHEAACLGDALARGDGFGDPWGRGTGGRSIPTTGRGRPAGAPLAGS